MASIDDGFSAHGTRFIAEKIVLHLRRIAHTHTFASSIALKCLCVVKKKMNSPAKPKPMHFDRLRFQTWHSTAHPCAATKWKINDWYVIVINFSWNVHRSSTNTHTHTQLSLLSVGYCHCISRHILLFGIFKMLIFSLSRSFAVLGRCSIEQCCRQLFFLII